MARPAALLVPFRRVGYLVVGLLLAFGLPLADTAARVDETTKPAPTTPAESKPALAVVGKSANVETVRLINDKLTEKWQDNKLTPSPRCTDHEFIRRASLDIIGRIATPKEVSQFFKDAPEVRRAWLVERLL